jgi:hypothetical protein
MDCLLGRMRMVKQRVLPTPLSRWSVASRQHTHTHTVHLAIVGRVGLEIQLQALTHHTGEDAEHGMRCHPVSFIVPKW